MATRVPPRVSASTLFRPQVYNVRRYPGRSFHSSVPRKDVYQDANLAVRIIPAQWSIFIIERTVLR
jgi:hypothetical protein